jgi:hypothetical protein
MASQSPQIIDNLSIATRLQPKPGFGGAGALI